MSVQPPPPPVWSDERQLAANAVIGTAAGFWIRFVAFLIDGLILMVLMSLLIGVLVGIGLAVGREGPSRDVFIGLGVFVGVIGVIVIGWLYEALMTSSPRGATYGKRALGLRIVRADGVRLSFGRATGRHFLKALITPLVPLAIGYLLAAFTNGKLALHDFMADTLVIRVS